MVCGAIAEQGRKGEVPVREKWVVVVWVVVEVEEDAQASRWRDCHRALRLELELSWAVELEMLDVVVQGMSRVVGTERLVQCVAVAAVLSVVLVRWAVAVVWHVSMAKDTA